MRAQVQASAFVPRSPCEIKTKGKTNLVVAGCEGAGEQAALLIKCCLRRRRVSGIVRRRRDPQLLDLHLLEEACSVHGPLRRPRRRPAPSRGGGRRRARGRGGRGRRRGRRIRERREVAGRSRSGNDGPLWPLPPRAAAAAAARRRRWRTLQHGGARHLVGESSAEAEREKENGREREVLAALRRPRGEMSSFPFFFFTLERFSICSLST